MMHSIRIANIRNFNNTFDLPNYAESRVQQAKEAIINHRKKQ